jgi:hypothetical protein
MLLRKLNRRSPYMKYNKYIIILILFVCIHSDLDYGYSDDPKLEMSIELSISVIGGEVKIGTQPKFLLKIINNKNEDVKILNLEKRKDLINSKINIVITQLDKDVPFDIDISDPGRITEKDYITLSPNEHVFISIDDYYKNYKFEKSGLCKVTVQFYNFPYFYIKSKTTYFYVK